MFRVDKTPTVAFKGWGPAVTPAPVPVVPEKTFPLALPVNPVVTPVAATLAQFVKPAETGGVMGLFGFIGKAVKGVAGVVSGVAKVGAKAVSKVGGVPGLGALAGTLAGIGVPGLGALAGKALGAISKWGGKAASATSQFVGGYAKGLEGGKDATAEPPKNPLDWFIRLGPVVWIATAVGGWFIYSKVLRRRGRAF